MAFVLDRESSTMEYNPAIGSRRFQSPSIHSTGMAPVTVLIVEDDELVRELGVEFLSDAGFQVLEATNGEEALSFLESNPNTGVFFPDFNWPVRWMVLRWPRSRQCNGLISRSS